MLTLFPKPYFLIIQGLILLIFGILSMQKKKKEYFIFPSKLHFSLYLVAAIAIGYCFNGDYQLFCIPVLWTKIVLVIYSLFLVSTLVLKNIFGEIIKQLMLGAGLFISLYIIFFGSIEYWIWSFIQNIFIVPVYFLSKFLNTRYHTRFFDAFNLFGVSVFLPYIILIWTIGQVLNKKLIHKISLGAIPVVCLLIGITLTFRINMIISEIDKADNKQEKIESLLNNDVDKYLTELILGAHWKYHTKICLYDGWRPPFHDPVLGFAQQFLYTGKQFHNEMGLSERIDLYIKVFPENDIDFDCRCAKNERLGF